MTTTMLVTDKTRGAVTARHGVVTMCVGGGCEPALSRDMTVASEPSSFALPEVKRGFVATGVRTRIGQ